MKVKFFLTIFLIGLGIDIFVAGEWAALFMTWFFLPVILWAGDRVLLEDVECHILSEKHERKKLAA